MHDGAGTPSLKSLLGENRPIMVPGAFDALSAKLAAQAGFEAVYMTGFGVAGSTLGMPDIGLMSGTEMADRARAMASATAPVPLIADADTGHGGTLNVARLVTLYEQAGVQAIQLEDQVFPKRCGHMASKDVIDRIEARDKIAAAVAARRSDGFLVIARTDARAVLGFDEAMQRGEDFIAAGADLLFIEAPQSLTEMQTITQHFGGHKLVANMVEDGKTPYLSAQELGEMGYALMLYPVSSLLATAQLLKETYAAMRQAGKLPNDTNRMSFSGYNTAIGLDELLPTALPYSEPEERLTSVSNPIIL
ncbi:2-Methylisocitrate lyase, PEP mutase family [Pseudosulfitobacter pseudonitzschiae]|uniref:Carboxyvinyl-carboxyphosphonate phosphorylmutase n=1 Tax=Pseudosulfitobacter pseudonitzschiae TaxID=1402135 RepID=A0A073IYN3_9RHOB|nr:isocitrate lyase/PEP mutase family protein [Pseudosulfitobacter pseudonitzschiae]KEJ94859.1 carboxyvinyl-carboxyphosphonate phosphorylmutase [Pseudosulfitobacter pseudonitzschiae]QKS07335.1 isocitrate lyase/PEP mutase family protein [Pseudosulfitobacter pseudonitzschiae]SHF95291.1 2-Methylisocitrate lyase, PEP mutase family [Pseudosulfitobacter pseudonitzschiae]